MIPENRGEGDIRSKLRAAREKNRKPRSKSKTKEEEKPK